MKVRAWDWNAQKFVEQEYPDIVLAEFLDYLLNTKQWREDPDRLYERTRKFEKQLAEYRALDAAERNDLDRLVEAAQFDGKRLSWADLMVGVRQRKQQRLARVARFKGKKADVAREAEAEPTAAPAES